MKDNPRKEDGNENGQLVDWNDNAGLSLLQSGVKAQPACAGGHVSVK